MITAGQKVHFIADGPASLNLGGHQVGPLVLPGGGEDNVGDVGELEYQSVSQSVSQSVIRIREVVKVEKVGIFQLGP